MTIQGNKSTIPKGMDIEEFPLMRMRRRKNNEYGGQVAPFRETSSPEGRDDLEGVLLVRDWKRPMSAKRRAG